MADQILKYLSCIIEIVKTTVVNIYQSSYDVYIGRAGHGKDGTFGNPFSDKRRELNIESFKIYFYDRINEDVHFRQQVLQLKGKTLGCFCAPKPCHGHVIAEYLDGIKTYAVIGSRSFSDYEYLKRMLKWHDIKSIVSGGAKGADSLAKRYAHEFSIPLTEFLPQWDIYGKSAGFKRNELIISACDEVIAFWDKQSHGTKHSISLAEQQSKPTYIYWSEIDEIGELI